MMSKAMKNVSNVNSGVGEDDRVTMMFVNQIRENPGIHYGSPITRPGGHALKFASFITMEVKAGKPILDADNNRIGHKMVVKLDKSKSARPFQSVELDLYYGQGLCTAGSLLDAAVSAGVVTQSGAYYKYEGETLGQGRTKAVDRLKENADLAEKLERATVVAFEEKGLDVAFAKERKKGAVSDRVAMSDDDEIWVDQETANDLETLGDTPAPVEEGLISL